MLSRARAQDAGSISTNPTCACGARKAHRPGACANIQNETARLRRGQRGQQQRIAARPMSTRRLMQTQASAQQAVGCRFRRRVNHAQRRPGRKKEGECAPKSLEKQTRRPS